ncbi:D-Ala-D-Ala carboxypeptidase family metallohydrolase [Marinobacter nauticus]|uniref:Peptidase M15A C-terminal domain-containing protein n=1 Tax=Marinobacter nauticus TaxID=2743 RepID=A0A833JSF9_MARNT|nr:D-Ala-D-Ala carboxypeptidase family metallohydrolase [Marinobacter nauticus]KAE8545335.1 hypothetical protein F6453_2307 [Marinobacter nauticus]
MRYFKPSEFNCPCCGDGFDHMSQELLIHLDAARHMAGIPFVISSAYRRENHNADVGGVRAFSVEKHRITPRDLWILKPWLAR